LTFIQVLFDNFYIFDINIHLVLYTQ